MGMEGHGDEHEEQGHPRGEPERAERSAFGRRRDRPPPALVRDDRGERHEDGKGRRRRNEQDGADERQRREADGRTRPCATARPRARACADRQRRGGQGRQGEEAEEAGAPDRKGRPEVRKVRALRRGDTTGEERVARRHPPSRPDRITAAQARQTRRKQKEPQCQEPRVRAREEDAPARVREARRGQKADRQPASHGDRVAAGGHEAEPDRQEECQDERARPGVGSRGHRRDAPGEQRSFRVAQERRGTGLRSDGFPVGGGSGQAEGVREGRGLDGKGAPRADDSRERILSREAPVEQLDPRRRPLHLQGAGGAHRRDARRGIAPPRLRIAAGVGQHDPGAGRRAGDGLPRAGEQPFALHGDSAAFQRPRDFRALGEGSRASVEILGGALQGTMELGGRFRSAGPSARQLDPSVEPGQRRDGGGEGGPERGAFHRGVRVSGGRAGPLPARAPPRWLPDSRHRRGA